MTQEVYLEACYLMDKNLELSSGSLENGKKLFTKWTKYSDLKRTNSDASNYNLRTICLTEIVIEFDNKDGTLTREKAKEWVSQVSKKLQDAGINHTIWDYDESVSPHLHIKDITDLETINREEVSQLKKSIAEYFCTEEQRKYIDTTKFGLRTLIAIEDTPHWKYGSIKNLIFSYSDGLNNSRSRYFLNPVDELHSNMSNRGNRSNPDNHGLKQVIDIGVHTKDHLPQKIVTLKQQLRRLNKKQFGWIEPEEVRQRDLEWYNSIDFSKGGLTYKPNEKYPYTFLHRGVNVIRFYKKIKEEKIGGYDYIIYEVKAYFMFELKFWQYGYLAIPKSLDNRLFNHVIKISMQNPQIKDLFGLTLIINKFGNSRFPSYEFEILNHVYTEEFVQEIEKLKKEGLFDLVPLLVPKFELLRLIREKNNTYKDKTWLNKMEAILRRELKIKEHIDMINLTRELLKLGITEEEIHKMCQINYENEYSFKACQEQIDSIKKYLAKKENTITKNKFLEEWSKQIDGLHHESGN